MMYVCGHDKDDFLTSIVAPPKSNAPRFKLWKSENNVVMFWLINSMIPEISKNFLLNPTVCAIWEAACETYSSSENSAELFEAESIIHDLRQGDVIVTSYFNSLTHYWQQLDLFEVLNWKYIEYDNRYKLIVEQKQLFKFLSGLNQNLDEVCGRLLSTKPLPSLCEAFSEVRCEES